MARRAYIRDNNLHEQPIADAPRLEMPSCGAPRLWPLTQHHYQRTKDGDPRPKQLALPGNDHKTLGFLMRSRVVTLPARSHETLSHERVGGRADDDPKQRDCSVGLRDGFRV